MAGERDRKAIGALAAGCLLALLDGDGSGHVMKASSLLTLGDRDKRSVPTVDTLHPSSHAVASQEKGWKTDDAALAREVERLLIEYSFGWEGYVEWVIDRPEVTARWNGYSGFAGCLRFDVAESGRYLSALLQGIERGKRTYTWVLNPDATPPDVINLMQTLGYSQVAQWDGLVLDDLSANPGLRPGVTVESLCKENALAYCDFLRLLSDERMSRLEALACVQRYLQIDPKEAQIWLARVGSQAAGFAVLRIEPHGFAYLRQAATLPEFRNQGVYLSLLSHRLSIAREMGCTAALVQAMTATSAPILRKRGFRKVCSLIGYARTAPAAAKSDNRKTNML
ncbi:MAG TPA: GNAT family N-acetyltransferase [Chloroflexota bacterium]